MRKAILFFTLFAIFCFLLLVIDAFWIGSEADIQVYPTKLLTKAVVMTSDEKKVSKASEYFYDEFLNQTRFNGSILVAKNGKIVFEKYHGLTDLNEGNPIDSSTSFHLASVSKTFTAMAILKLWENNLLQIDSPAVNYLPQFPYPNITIRNLLSHRSGIPNYVHFVESMGWNSNKNLTNNDLLTLMNNNKQKIRVGGNDSYFEYSNTNYALLALIIEQVAKTSYANFLENTFFKPIGMNHSFVFNMEMKDKVLPSFKFNNRKENFTFLDAVYGDKNIYSTVRDMLRWDLAINDGNMFKKETLDAAFQGYSHEKKGIKNYGLGWRLYELPSGKKIIYHNGWWHGNNTVFSRFPSDSTTIIVLGNKFNKSIYQSKRIIGIYEGYGFQFIEDD
jgi:CubicO group peptidase (beta-lactamase class C family)